MVCTGPTHIDASDPLSKPYNACQASVSFAELYITINNVGFLMLTASVPCRFTEIDI